MADEENFRVFEGLDDLVQELTGQERRQKDLERTVVAGIAARYADFLRGAEPRKILYKGDFRYAVNPWELVLPDGDNELSVPYERLVNALFIIVGNDIVGKISGDMIQKFTDEETGNLNRFRQRNPNARFTVNAAYFKLKSPPQKERVLQFETYFPDQSALFPLSLIVMAKKRDMVDSGGGNNTNRYRLQPRSAVRTGGVFSSWVRIGG